MIKITDFSDDESADDYVNELMLQMEHVPSGQSRAFLLGTFITSVKEISEIILQRGYATLHVTDSDYISLRCLKSNNDVNATVLMQSELQGIDPFDPELDSVTKAKIQFECKYNPWYYFKEVVRASPKVQNVLNKDV